MTQSKDAWEFKGKETQARRTTDKQWEKDADVHSKSHEVRYLSDSAVISSIFVVSFYVFCRMVHFSSSNTYTVNRVVLMMGSARDYCT